MFIEFHYLISVVKLFIAIPICISLKTTTTTTGKKETVDSGGLFSPTSPGIDNRLSKTRFYTPLLLCILYITRLPVLFIEVS